jgi:hypothetical protein
MRTMQISLLPILSGLRKKVLEHAKMKYFKRVVTLSPLTPMATHYHIRNEAKLIGLNTSTQNFEYSLKN